MFCDQIQPQISGINPYVPGKPISELQRELGLKRISKLASNENPLGASLKVAAAIQAALADVARYPDGNAFYLKSELANFFNLSVSHIALGNGSNETLEMVARVFAGAGDEILYSQYAFAVYPICAQVVGATGVEVPAKNWGHDLNAMLKAITSKTKIIFLANPNNPTGTLFRRKEWEYFISQVPKQVIVVLDEAYVEYVEDPEYANGRDYLEEYPNLLVSRTFSKAYGLASLRVGFMLGSAEVIAYLNRIREPFNLNHFAQVAAIAALQDNAFVAKGVALNKVGMYQITSALDEMKLAYIPSSGNFICVEFNKPGLATEINDALLKQGVIVRPLANYKMPNHLRVSIGSGSENQHFIDALKNLAHLYA